jgi:glycyl-tRNA synthetase beta chain
MSTANFLVEIGTEELPPKALRSLRAAFEQAICDGLQQKGIAFGGPGGEMAAPRRLAVLITDVEQQQPEQTTELLGPAVAAAFDDAGAPTGAALGFARKAGVEVSDLQQVDSPKGPRLAHVSVTPGQATAELLPEIVNKALDNLPIPKRMRWGDKRDEFVRPVHWVLMLLGDQPVPGTVMNLESGTTTRGHRFHANHDIEIKDADSYVRSLRELGKVDVDYQARMDTIRTSVALLAEKELSGKAVIGQDLLEEVTSLVEWPVPLAGNFDTSFLEVPPEALISSMREHQKYFHVVDRNDQLMPHFITVANIESLDPAKVVNGNERVIRPRLADAAFFFTTDKKTNFASFRSRLKDIVFQKQLGSIFDKTERLADLAEKIAPYVGAKPEDARRAGELAKCDLVSEMVLEFDDLQGIMGRYYAELSGENQEVSTAMYEQYLPRFAGDELPVTATGKALALADRLDTLTGIFGIGQQPTGSRDPFALRRASLGVLRILVEGGFKVSLTELLETALDLHTGTTEPRDPVVEDLLNYLLDRFSAWFSDDGIATENFLSVRALGIDDAADINARVKAVAEFSKSENSSALAAANKRVANILNKSDVEPGAINANLFESPAENELAKTIDQAYQALAPLIQSSSYSAALDELSKLRKPVDQFFDEVMVNADDMAIRTNRLSLLSEMRQLFLSVADISLLTGQD